MQILTCEKILSTLPHAGQDRVQTVSSLFQNTHYGRSFTHKDIMTNKDRHTYIQNARHISNCAWLAIVNINVWY